MKPAKEPTITCLIVKVLEARDDFMTARQLFEELRLPGGREQQLRRTIYKDLLWLRSRNVVDVVIQNGVSYWYLQPPENDNRVRRHDEKVPVPTRASKRRKPSA